MTIHTIRFTADKPNRSATVNFGESMPVSTARLAVAYDQAEKPPDAALNFITEVEQGVYVIESASESGLMGAIGHFVHIGVSLQGWPRSSTEVIETIGETERQWSLGTDEQAEWLLVP